MTRRTHIARPIAALLVAGLAVTLAACGRESKVIAPAVSGPATWGNTISHLFADRSEGTTPTGCTSCHHAGTTIEDWTSYATVVADTELIRARLSNPTDKMRGFLKPGEPEVVIAWIGAGAPQ